ncbi:MAG: response regulator [candidate division KSB1 bacterium]|nr:response regulator [candidate division KSB1 bacterium]
MKTILVVDDEKNLRLLYQRELEEAGYRVLTAANGEEALNMLRKDGIDLAVLDIKMEGKDGLQTLREMMDEKRDLKVILNTAYSTYKSNFASWSADAYLIKSSDLDELKLKIKELLGE